jgi:hypothetical protein
VGPCRRFDFNALPWLELNRQGRCRDGVECIKISRSRQVLKIDRPRDFGAELDLPLYAKCYQINSLRRRVGNLLTGGKAAAEFHLGLRLLGQGMETAQPLACAIATAGRIPQAAAGDGIRPGRQFPTDVRD